jgi:3D (Asp-Asp-Asp) domain-containing protein
MAQASAPTPVNYSEGVDTLVAEQYLNGAWDNTMRQNVTLERLKKANKINDRFAGKYAIKRVRVGRFQESQHTRLGERTFPVENHHVQYAVPVVPHEVTFALSEEDIAYFQSGGQNSIDHSKSIITDVGTDFEYAINARLLTGNSTSNTIGGVATSTDTLKFSGLVSVFDAGATATGYSLSGGSTGSAVLAADKEVLPNGTYFGVTTNPTAAISGVDNRVTEATSPVIANWSSTAWNSTGSTTYAVNACDTIDHLLNRLRVRKDIGKMAGSQFGVQTVEMHNDFVRCIRSKTNSDIVVANEAREPDAGMYPRLWVQWNGVKIYADINQAASWVYLLDAAEMEYFVMRQGSVSASGRSAEVLKGQTPRYITVRQQYDIKSGAQLGLVQQQANMFANPFHQAAAYSFA